MSSGVFREALRLGPLWCEIFRRFITNKLKIYVVLLGLTYTVYLPQN